MPALRLLLCRKKLPLFLLNKKLISVIQYFVYNKQKIVFFTENMWTICEKKCYNDYANKQGSDACAPLPLKKQRRRFM